MAEQLICNQQVDGSTPFTSSSDIRRHRRRIIPNSISYGSGPEWPKGTDCKSAGNAFGGPNPPAPTTTKARPNGRAFVVVRVVVPSGHRVVKICEADLHATRQGGGRIGGFAAVHPLRMCRAFLVVRVLSLWNTAR